MRSVSTFVFWMAFGALMFMAFCKCAPMRPMPTPEEMPAGRKECKAMCWKVGRQYDEYRYNGDCICKPVGAE